LQISLHRLQEFALLQISKKRHSISKTDLLSASKRELLTISLKKRPIITYYQPQKETYYQPAIRLLKET
jgi:hypothetical protein